MLMCIMGLARKYDNTNIEKCDIHSNNTEIYILLKDLVTKYGADVNLESLNGYNPLGIAQVHGDTQMADWLVEHGADPRRTVSKYTRWLATHDCKIV